MIRNWSEQFWGNWTMLVQSVYLAPEHLAAKLWTDPVKFWIQNQHVFIKSSAHQEEETLSDLMDAWTS